MNLVFQCLFCYTRVSTNTTHITVFSFAVYFLVFHIPLLISFHEKDLVIIKFERPLSWLISNLERVPIARVHGRDWGYFFRLLLDRQRSSFFPATRGERKCEIMQINGKRRRDGAGERKFFLRSGFRHRSSPFTRRVTCSRSPRLSQSRSLGFLVWCGRTRHELSLARA